MTCGGNTKGRGRSTPDSLRGCACRQTPCRGEAIGKQVQSQGSLWCVFTECGSQACPLGSGPRAGRHTLPSTDGLRSAQCTVQWVWGYSPRPTPSLWAPLTPAHPRPLCGRPCPGRAAYVESHAVWPVCPASLTEHRVSKICPGQVAVHCVHGPHCLSSHASMDVQIVPAYGFRSSRGREFAFLGAETYGWDGWVRRGLWDRLLSSCCPPMGSAHRRVPVCPCPRQHRVLSIVLQ